MPESNELPEEIEKACDDGRTVPWDEWSRNLCRALLAEVRRMVDHANVQAIKSAIRGDHDILSECERRYARRGVAMKGMTTTGAPFGFPIVEDPSVPPGELRAVSKDPVRATYGDEVADWIKSKVTTPDTASTIAPPPKEPEVEPAGIAPWMVPLWDEIHRYAACCGGDPSKHFYGNVSRMDAVAKIDNIVRDEIARAARGVR